VSTRSTLVQSASVCCVADMSKEHSLGLAQSGSGSGSGTVAVTGATFSMPKEERVLRKERRKKKK